MHTLTAADFAGTRRLPAWPCVATDTPSRVVGGLGLFVAATTAMFAQSLALHEDLVRETRMVATNAGMRLLGLTSGPSVGGYMLHREYVTLAVLAALMSTFAVIRHTRQNEELGRAEILGSTPWSVATPAWPPGVLVAVAADVVLALVLAAGIAVSGQPVEGALLAGASVAAVGLVWVGVAAVTCQLSSTTRGAAGIAAGALGIAFALSGIGNMIGTVDQAGLRVTSAWPAWLSPIGWGQQTRPFGGAHWWPLLLAVAALGDPAGHRGRARLPRDVGRGLWPERRGHAEATRALLSPGRTGLAAATQRVHRMGHRPDDVRADLRQPHRADPGPRRQRQDWWTEAGGTDQVVDAYQVSIIQMAGMFVAIYLVQVLLRMRVDETGGTLEPVLASGVTRTRWLWGHLLNAVAGCIALMVLFAVSMGLTAGQVLGNARHPSPRPRLGRPRAGPGHPGRRCRRGCGRVRPAPVVGPGQLGHPPLRARGGPHVRPRAQPARDGCSTCRRSPTAPRRRPPRSRPHPCWPWPASAWGSPLPHSACCDDVTWSSRPRRAVTLIAASALSEPCVAGRHFLPVVEKGDVPDLGVEGTTRMTSISASLSGPCARSVAGVPGASSRQSGFFCGIIINSGQNRGASWIHSDWRSSSTQKAQHLNIQSALAEGCSSSSVRLECLRYTRGTLWASTKPLRQSFLAERSTPGVSTSS